MKIEQKKGDPIKMHGKLTAYAIIDDDAQEYSGSHDSPLFAMIQSGYLVAQGNYRDQNSLRDFLQQELGTTLDDENGIKEFVEGLGGIEGALDPDKFREKINHLEEIEDFIPTPAKMVQYHAENEILAQEGDIYFVGKFSNPANANLAVNAATILYQAQYRESQIHHLRSEIDDMIMGTEELPEQTTIPHIEDVIEDAIETVEQKLVKIHVPKLLMSVGKDTERNNEVQDLRDFLSNYAYPEDIDRLITLTSSTTITPDVNRLIMLYCEKIDAVIEEQFDSLPAVITQIQQLEINLDGDN